MTEPGLCECLSSPCSHSKGERVACDNCGGFREHDLRTGAVGPCEACGNGGPDSDEVAPWLSPGVILKTPGGENQTWEPKAIRAKVIADYVRAAGFRGVVCFSCGNASRELKKLIACTLDISPFGDLQS